MSRSHNRGRRRVRGPRAHSLQRPLPRRLSFEPLELRRLLAADFDLADLLPANGGDGSQGFTLFGVDPGDWSGYAVSSAGDVNGDGFDDLLIGAPYGSGSGNSETYAGESYVVFGKADFSATPTIDLGTLDGTDGFTLFGVDAFDYSGEVVSSTGDVNGDGFDDLLITAAYAEDSGNSETYAGESYVVFGKADFSATPTIDLGTLNGTDGFTLFGVDAFDYSGWAAGIVGDVNGDGFDDLLIGAPYSESSGNSEHYAGESYVVFGKADFSATPTIDLGALDGTDGFTLFGVDSGDRNGLAVPLTIAADVNGDGFDDLVIGSTFADGASNSEPNAGETYVVFGKADFSATPTIDLGTLDGTDGFTLFGVGPGDRSGIAVSAGDVNGDGFDDVLIGADGKTSSPPAEGRSYVVFGKADFSATPTIDLGTLDGTDGFTLIGVDTYDRSGWSVSAGDFNGDGFDDVLTGTRFADGASNSEPDAGESYVVFGKADFSATATIDLGTLGVTDGFTLFGVDSYDRSGQAVSSAGDVNGDGIDDLVIGAPKADGASNSEPDAGEVYVVFGVNTTTGTDVETAPIDEMTDTSPVELSFSEVTVAGATSLTISSDGESPPTGFKLGDPPTYYELTTTAEFSGAVTVTIDYSGISVGDESNLKFFHFEDTDSDEVADTWIDRTVSVDTVNDIITGSVTSFSLFAIFEPNLPPVILDQSFDVDENSAPVGDVLATDPDEGDTLSYGISGGVDGVLFDIDPDTGALSFKIAPDFEMPADDGGDNVYNVQVTVTDDSGESDIADVTVNVLNEVNETSVTGFVFADVDNDGVFDIEDAPLANVKISLTEAGVDEVFGTADDETFTTMTDNDGFYGFEGVAAGKVRINESDAPADLVDGVDTPNGVIDLDTVNDQFTIDLALTDVNGMNFAEQADAGGLGSDDTATIGYWQNKNGQELIETLDEGGALTDWLLDNFGNIFDQADFDEYGGSVGEFYRSEFFKQKLKGTPKVDAQFTAVAFATFATSSNLSNGNAVNFGFTVTDSGIGTTVVNVGSSGAAFGVADNTDMTIMALLLATNNLTGLGADMVYDGAQDLLDDGVVDDTLGSLGTLDDFEKMLRVMANDLYTDINKGGDI